MMRFWPLGSTKIGATPVDTPSDDLHVARVDAEGLEIADRGFAEQIVADFGDHEHLGTAQARGDGLIGTLAAEAEIETLSEDRLSGTRKRVCESDQVGIGTADDGYSGCPGHSIPHAL